MRTPYGQATTPQEVASETTTATTRSRTTASGTKGYGTVVTTLSKGVGRATPGVSERLSTTAERSLNDEPASNFRVARMGAGERAVTATLEQGA